MLIDSEPDLHRSERTHLVITTTLERVLEQRTSDDWDRTANQAVQAMNALRHVCLMTEIRKPATATSVYLSIRPKVPMFLLDTGCGKMMGGQDAVKDYLAAVREMGLGIPMPTLQPGKHPFHVANGQTTYSKGHYRLPEFCGPRKTDFQCDVGDWPRVPILLSMNTMREMRMILRLRPIGNAEGSWIEFPEDSPCRAQQVLDLPGGLRAMRPCIVDPEREAKLEGKRVYWLEDGSSTCSTDVPDADFAGDWSDRWDPETWWPLDPCEEDGQTELDTFDGEQLDGWAAWASVHPEVYRRLAAGESDAEELRIAIQAVHDNLGHSRNVDKLMRLFPEAYRDRRTFNRVLNKCRGCTKLGKAPVRLKAGGNWLLRATRPGQVWAFDYFKYRCKWTKAKLKCMHFCGHLLRILDSPDKTTGTRGARRGDRSFGRNSVDPLSPGTTCDGPQKW